jgi:hypothetical protein
VSSIPATRASCDKRSCPLPTCVLTRISYQGGHHRRLETGSTPERGRNRLREACELSRSGSTPDNARICRGGRVECAQQVRVDGSNGCAAKSWPSCRSQAGKTNTVPRIGDDLSARYRFRLFANTLPLCSAHSVDKLVRLYLQASSESHHRQKANVGLSPFKRPDIVSVELCQFRELFLRQPSVLSKFAQTLAKSS